MFSELIILTSNGTRSSHFPIVNLGDVFMVSLNSMFQNLVIVTVNVSSVVRETSLVSSPLTLNYQQQQHRRSSFIIFSSSIRVNRLVIGNPILAIKNARFPSRPIFNFVPTLSRMGAIWERFEVNHFSGLLQVNPDANEGTFELAVNVPSATHCNRSRSSAWNSRSFTVFPWLFLREPLEERVLLGIVTIGLE